MVYRRKLTSRMVKDMLLPAVRKLGRDAEIWDEANGDIVVVSDHGFFHVLVADIRKEQWKDVFRAGMTHLLGRRREARLAWRKTGRPVGEDG
jgi:hypothetical protein